MSVKPSIAEEFNEMANDYTEKIRRWVPNYDQLVHFAAQVPDDLKSPDVLDVGAGNGNVSTTIMRTFMPRSITLLDAAEEMLQLSAARLSDVEDVRTLNSYFQDASFSPESFDFVTCCLALHHLEPSDKKDFISKVFGWLRPGACIAIADLMINKSNEDHQDLVDDWRAFAQMKGATSEEWQHVMDHYELYDRPSSLELHWQILKSAGYEYEKVRFKQSKWMVISARKPK